MSDFGGNADTGRRAACDRMHPGQGVALQARTPTQRECLRWPLAGIALVLVLGLSPALAAPAPRVLSGAVHRVTDGDSLWFTPLEGAALEVRLRDIDAPEICQAWGEEARRALVELVLDRPARLEVKGPDKHGRTLGVLWVGEVNVGQRLVEEGHAWSIRTRWDRGPLVKQEKMARALGRGLHADGAAQWPQDFRRAHGRCGAYPAAPPAL